jgi:small subunit ribosomal protein S13
MLLLGKHLNTNKALNYTLKNIFGINIYTANTLCGILGVSPNVRLNQLNVYHYDKLVKICSEQIDVNLSRQVVENIKQLIQIKHFKGVRHMFGLPSRGQRTRTNAATSKKVMAKILSSNLKKRKK